jgi:TolB protein
MDADGRHQRLLVDDEPGFRLQSPSYAPDGSLVYARCLPDDGVCAIWAANGDGTGAHALTPFRTGREEAVDFEPVVSPDGAHVAFTRFFWHGIVSQVYVMGIDGSNPQPITEPRFEGAAPDFTPDGRIVFTTSSNLAGSDIRIVDASGGRSRAVTRTRYPANSFHGTVSPAGTWVAYANDVPYPDVCCADLVVQPLLHGRARRLALAVNGVVNPSWSPVAVP